MNFNEYLSKDEIMTIISNDLKTTGFSIKSYNLKSGSDSPLGFMGILIKIRADIETMHKESKTVHYFAKKIPVVSSHQSFALETGAYYKEIEMYKTVLVDYLSSKKPTRKWCPDFFYSRNEEILVIEDLSAKGFFMFPERQLMPLHYVLETVKSMAVMHAAAMIFEEKLKAGKCSTRSGKYRKGGPVTMDVLYPNLMFETECSDDPGHSGNAFYEAGFKSQLPIVDLLPGYSDKQRKTIKEKLPNVLRLILQRVKPSNKYRNVIVHGDLWSNNMMYRCDEKNNITDVVFIDFALARLAPPMQDLRTFLHLVQTREFREQREAEILNLYYATMTEEFQMERLEISDAYSREEFENSFHDLYEWGLLFQLICYQLCLLPPHISGKFLSSEELFRKNMLVDRSDMIVETFQTDQLCRQRITEVMNEIIEYFQLIEDNVCDN